MTLRSATRHEAAGHCHPQQRQQRQARGRVEELAGVVTVPTGAGLQEKTLVGRSCCSRCRCGGKLLGHW